MKYKGSHMVEDASGARFELYEFLGWRMYRRVRRYVLDTGDPAWRIDDNTFELIRTGEPFVLCGAAQRGERELHGAGASSAQVLGLFNFAR